jgi:hypothetical protein
MSSGFLWGDASPRENRTLPHEVRARYCEGEAPLSLMTARFCEGDASMCEGGSEVPAGGARFFQGGAPPHAMVARV